MENPSRLKEEGRETTDARISCHAARRGAARRGAGRRGAARETPFLLDL